MIKKIKTDRLKPGMYIHDFNSGWLQHPFFTNSTKVKNHTLIEKIIRHGINEVYIDTDRGLDDADAVPKSEVDQEVEAEISKGLEQDINENNIIPVQEEVARAHTILKNVNKTVRNMMENVKFGNQPDMDRIRGTVENMVGSILRNKDALIYLGRIKQKDEYTYTHSINVCILLMSLGKHLGFDSRTIKDLGLGGLLHDIGKLKLPDGILNKKGRLTEDEYIKAQEHVNIGKDILEQNPDIDETSFDIITQHHERWDGSGYPNRLKGGEINMFGQMAAIVDVYDSITTDRVYKNKILPTVALKKLYEWSKFHFNRVLVQRFIRCIGIYPVGTLVRLESGLLGIVLNHDEKDLLHPVVRVVFNTKKGAHVMPRDIDLSKSDSDRVAGYELPEKWSIRPEMYL